jgi:hypothetical protein
VRLIVSQSLELSSYCYRYCYGGNICYYWLVRYYCRIYYYWYRYCMLRANQQPEPHVGCDVRCYVNTVNSWTTSSL